MKKIFIFFCFFVFSFSYEYKYINFGFGNGLYKNKNGFYLNSDIGYGFYDKRIYLNLNNVYLGGNDELDVFSLSLNYDYIFYIKNNFKLYGGGGINYVDIDKTINNNYEDDYKFGFNLKGGVLYNISTHWALNLKEIYTYINHNDVKYIIGTILNLEYQF